MDERLRPRAPGHYELRIVGHLDERWSAWFGGLILTHEGDGTTSLRGAVTDQAELYGLIAKVRDLGAALISVTPIAGRSMSSGSYAGHSLQDERQTAAFVPEGDAWPSSSTR